MVGRGGLSWIIGSSQKRGFAHQDVLGSHGSHGALAKIRSNQTKLHFVGSHLRIMTK